jgi:hypothetical protein
MRKLVLILFTGLLGYAAHGQKTEFSFHLQGGLFSFISTDPGLDEGLLIQYEYRDQEVYYTNKPYGSRKYGLSYGLAGQLQRVTGNRFIVGLQAGYENLRNQVKIRQSTDFFTGLTLSAEGRTNLEHHFINFHPMAGYRFSLGTLVLDFTAGPDLAYSFAVREKGKVSLDNGREVEVNRRRSNFGADARIRMNIAASYRNVGITAGYSQGLVNYGRNLDGISNSSVPRILRFGVFYRLN